MTLEIIATKLLKKIRKLKTNTQISIIKLLDEEDRKIIKEENIDMFDLTEKVLEMVEEDTGIELTPLNEKGVIGLPWVTTYVVRNIKIDLYKELTELTKDKPKKRKMSKEEIDDFIKKIDARITELEAKEKTD